VYRAVRADKVVYAAIEATLRSFARGSAFEDIPTLRMLSMSLEELGARVEAFKARFDENEQVNVRLSKEPGFSAVGGGTGPGVEMPTRLMAILHRGMSADNVAAYLRAQTPPIITRIVGDRAAADLRTVPAQDEEILMDALLKLAAIDGQQQNLS
jgi:L-seryl-tRNA(Ser) seleniumtransferase